MSGKGLNEFDPICEAVLAHARGEFAQGESDVMYAVVHPIGSDRFPGLMLNLCRLCTSLLLTSTAQATKPLIGSWAYGDWHAHAPGVMRHLSRRITHQSVI
jgi:hypothetical protein